MRLAAREKRVIRAGSLAFGYAASHDGLSEGAGGPRYRRFSQPPDSCQACDSFVSIGSPQSSKQTPPFVAILIRRAIERLGFVLPAHRSVM